MWLSGWRMLLMMADDFLPLLFFGRTFLVTSVLMLESHDFGKQMYEKLMLWLSFDIPIHCTPIIKTCFHDQQISMSRLRF